MYEEHDFSWQKQWSDFMQEVVKSPWSYVSKNLRHDVVGKWGGLQAAIADIFEKDDDSHSCIATYILVDSYNNVGCWPGQNHPSKWETASLLCSAMRGGISHHKLYNAIVNVIADETDVSPEELIKVYKGRQ